MSLSNPLKKNPEEIPKKQETEPNLSRTKEQVLWLQRFERYIWDILGILLISFGLVTLLGLLNLTKGSLVVLWVGFLQLWFGWGSFLFIFFIILLGLISIRKHAVKTFKVSIGKVIVLELWTFLFVTFLSMIGGHSLERAENGLDGGLLGWGLADWFAAVFPDYIGTFVLLLFLILFALYGFGLLEILIRKLNQWAKAVRSEPDVEVPDQLEFNFEKVSSRQPLEKTPDILPVEKPVIRKRNLPALSLLRTEKKTGLDETLVHETARKIERTLDEFGIPARVVGFRVGPTVTQFAVEPGFIKRNGVNGETTTHKVRVSQISSLNKDLSLALSAQRLRIEAPVPGQSFVGIEVPNHSVSLVGLRSILESAEFKKLDTPLAIALGKDVSGRPIVADLSKMPHLLIAGTTGSGKSVCIAALTVCLVMNNTPDELKLAMLDPKMVELVRFNGLPHLLGKVETDIERMLGVLQWALQEMDRRYRLLEESRSRDIVSYNQKMLRHKKEPLPKIVIFIDELADLMMSAPEQTEHNLVRLAQMARATGIHLIVATQRPSTDVVTGLIKANFPARLSFSVASSIDSRVILDETGAETLLGRGDMLFLNPEVGNPIRAQGVIISDEEIEGIVTAWQTLVKDEKQMADEPEPEAAPWEGLIQDLDESGPDRLVSEAMDIVKSSQRASASYLQRRLRIGYPRAARLIDELEELGVVGPSLGGGREREVLISGAEEMDEENQIEAQEPEDDIEDDDLLLNLDDE